jgi:hypothetical protein
MYINDIEFRINKNKLNRLINPVGVYSNTTDILVDGVWYKCGISFEEKNEKIFMIFSHLKVVNGMNIKSTYHSGVYEEIEVSKFYMNWIKFKLNLHPIFFINNRLQDWWKKKRKIRLILGFVFVVTIFIQSTQLYPHNPISQFINNSPWINGVINFLNVLGIVGLFISIPLLLPNKKGA